LKYFKGELTAKIAALAKNAFLQHSKNKNKIAEILHQLVFRIGCQFKNKADLVANKVKEKSQTR